MKIQNIALMAAFTMATMPVFARTDIPAMGDLSSQVRHQLVMIPYYSVFDDLNYTVNDATGVVTLSGDVTWPVVKGDALNSVKKIPGVTKVVDNIHVLPLSPMDNQIRRAEYRAIYGFSTLSRYGVGSLRAIHIIVDNGHVRLIGTVDSQADKDTAYIRANAVPNVFSVTNDLRVAEKS